MIKAHAFKLEAERQYVSPKGHTFDRGTISFTNRDGSLVSAATTQAGFKIAFNPQKVTDRELFYTKLSALLPLDRATFDKKANKKNDPYEEIAERIPQDVADQVLALDLPSVQAVRQTWRFYPASTIGAHVLGFVAFQGDTLIGRYGLERTYEKTLARTDDRLFINFFADVFGRIRDAVDTTEGTEGDLRTTIEPSVQVFLEQQLALTQEKWNSDRVAGLIMNPKTGEVYALGVTPNFNLNEYSNVESSKVYMNPLVENVYEVGSIMKPIVMAIGLEAGVVTPDTMYTDMGSVKVGNRVINNFDKKARGYVSMQTVLNQSLNTGMVYVQQHIPKDTFHDKLRLFGFGEKTGIDLPGELLGLTKNLETKRDVEYANISFGQGVALTPIAMARALSALGNGGRLITPHIVKDIDYLGGGTKEIEIPAPKQVLDPAVSDEITRMLVGVFDSYGEGKYKMQHYSVAGKTGTAQVANPSGGYYEDRNLHSFFGYFPAYDPKFIVYLFNEYPKNGAQYASQTLIEPFGDIARFLISYYDIPPDR